MEKYETLKEQYPESISLTQLSKICKISKRSALYLIKNKLIPSVDIGNKKIRRYKITIDDVITYLSHREQWGTLIPPGAIGNSNNKNKKVKNTRKSFYQTIKPGYESEIIEYFNFIYTDYDEILIISEVAEMIGLHECTIRRLVRDGFIKYLAGSSRSTKYLIPKQYLFEFMITPRFIEAKTDSKSLKKILEGFEIWKTAKSSEVLDNGNNN